MTIKLISAAREEVSEAWFSPDFWGDKAVAVANGGRGGAWFISAPDGDMVLRPYRRGA